MVIMMRLLVSNFGKFFFGDDGGVYVFWYVS